jgi:phosphate transport system protein
MERMGSLVADQTEHALASLADRDAARASAVITGDAAVNGLQIEIDDRAVRLLALQAPAARDLRLVVAAIKANTDLERIGDQAVNIAETALRLGGMPAMPHEAVIADMGRLAVAMTRDALTSFLERDVALARRVLARDDEADRLKVEIIRQLIAAMTTDGAVIDHALGLVLVSRNLERIADHATNMAEDTIFIVEARDIRHHHADPA